MRDIWDYIDPEFTFEPLEAALKIFADYRIGDIGYAEYAANTQRLLTDEPKQRDMFGEITDRFQGDLFTPAAEPDEHNSGFDKIFREQGIIMSRHMRYMPPLLEQHDFIEIMYLYRGSATYHPNGKPLKMREGDFCIVAPGTKHNIYCHDDSSILLKISILPEVFNRSFLSMLSHDDVLAGFLLDILYQKSEDMSLVFRTGSDENIRHIIQRMIEEYNKSGSARVRLVGDWLRLMLSYMLRDYGDSVMIFNWVQANMQSGIAPVLGHLQVHYADATLESVAKQFYFSEGYLSRLIKRSTGLTFSQLLRNIRMDRAMMLLRRVGSTPEQVMQAVGYSDFAYFSRRFQEYSGQTLAEFMQTQLRDINGKFLR